MKIDSKYMNIKEIVEAELTCSAHNLDHVFRVCKMCYEIAKTEDNVDYDVLIPAALLHDIARVKESNDQTGKIDHAVLGCEISHEILKNLSYDEERIEKIKHCILTHRYRTGNEPKTIEAKILFDADKLDAIGSVGIARTFMLSGQFGQSLYSKESLEEYLKRNTAENGRIKDLSNHTPIIEYEFKLKKLPNKLQTKTGKEIGQKRMKFMDEFFETLKEELEI